jgi:8-oxo-dGTP pyrophosphatase MutT (NUDIX family)
MLKCTFENGNTTQSLRHVVVHAIVEQQGRFLLGRRHESFLEGGKLGLPAGYVERDETMSEAVLRELYEETGWEGRVLHVFRINSNPHRPGEDRQNISIDFIVEPIKQSGQPDWETPEVVWLPIDNDFDFTSLAFDHGDSIRLYLEWRLVGGNLPIID